MHSFQAVSGTTFHYNGDFSGDVTITHEHDAHNGLTIPIGDLADFIAELIRARRISAIENLTTHDLLGIDSHDLQA